MFKVVSKDGKETFGRGYATEEDAQAFIDSHLAPQKKGAKVVEDDGDGESSEASEASSEA